MIERSLERIDPSLAINLWPAILAELEEHPETWSETETTESIFHGLASGALQLWTILDEERRVRSMFLSRIFEYPKGPCLQIIWGSGQSVQDLTAAREGIEAIALKAGFIRIEVIGRVGWFKVYKDAGYRIAYQVLSKDLTRPPKNMEN